MASLSLVPSSDPARIKLIPLLVTFHFLNDVLINTYTLTKQLSIYILSTLSTTIHDDLQMVVQFASFRVN